MNNEIRILLEDYEDLKALSKREDVPNKEQLLSDLDKTIKRLKELGVNINDSSC